MSSTAPDFTSGYATPQSNDVERAKTEKEHKNKHEAKDSDNTKDSDVMTHTRKDDERKEEAIMHEIIPIETGEFPRLFNHLPRFYSVGVENSEISKEPTALSLYRQQFIGRWLLVITFPGLNFPYGPASAKQIFKKASAFEALDCDVFLLSIDPYSKLRTFRDSLEQVDENGNRPFNVKNIFFISDHVKNVSNRIFGVLTTSQDKTKSMNYPGYFLMTPDKELVQYCIIRNSKRLCERTGKMFFGYPFTYQVVDCLIDAIATLLPVFDAVKKLKATYPKATVGMYMEDALRHAHEEEEEEKTKWKGLARAAEDVFRGGVH